LREAVNRAFVIDFEQVHQIAIRVTKRITKHRVKLGPRCPKGLIIFEHQRILAEAEFGDGSAAFFIAEQSEAPP